MKKHLLSQVGKTVRRAGLLKAYYDIKSQMSYWDKKYVLPIMDGLNYCSTCETATTEDSDLDEFRTLGFNTAITENIEESDPDEFSTLDKNTSINRVINSCQVGKLTKLGTFITRSLEDSDADEFCRLEPTTKQTFTTEDSDVDEFTFGF